MITLSGNLPKERDLLLSKGVQKNSFLKQPQRLSSAGINAYESFQMTELGKFDLETRVLTTWNEPGYSVIEPIFVPSPQSQSEDDGIVLTVMHDQKKENAFLVTLDGRTFKEIARTKMPRYIPGSLHGQYFSESTFIVKE